MEREEWLRRCAARYETLAGLHLNQARELAEIALDTDESSDFEDDPEGAADEDMSYWSDDA